MSTKDRRRFLRELGVGALAGVAAPAFATDAGLTDSTVAPRADGRSGVGVDAVPRDAVERTVDVAVVGAGLAGLTAAYELKKLGHRVHVVEADERVGGRVWTTRAENGAAVDMGAHFVGATQTRILALAKELGVESYSVFTAGKNVQLFDGERKLYEGTVPELDVFSLLDTKLAFNKLEGLAEKVNPEAPWEAADAEEWDSQTVWSWVREHLYTSGGRKLLDLAVVGLLGSQSRDVSLLYLLFYIRAAGGMNTLLDIKGGAQEFQFVGGAQQLADRLAERIGLDSVTVGSPVREIVQGGEQTEVLADGARLKARRVILALPPPMIPRIGFDPPLSALKDQLYQRLPMGSIGKSIGIYDTPFWRDKGLSGLATSDGGPLSAVFDTSPADGSCGMLMGFTEGQEARKFGALSPQERRRAALEHLAVLFGEEARRPREYHEVHWDSLELHRGCPVAVAGPGALVGFGPALRAGEGTLHFASTETATQWSGYMEGAIQAGQRAAKEVAAALTLKARAVAGPRAPE